MLLWGVCVYVCVTTGELNCGMPVRKRKPNPLSTPNPHIYMHTCAVIYRRDVYDLRIIISERRERARAALPVERLQKASCVEKSDKHTAQQPRACECNTERSHWSWEEMWWNTKHTRHLILIIPDSFTPAQCWLRAQTEKIQNIHFSHPQSSMFCVDL